MCRGVGGIFYDDLSSSEAGFDVLGFTKVAGAMCEVWPWFVTSLDAQEYYKYVPLPAVHTVKKISLWPTAHRTLALACCLAGRAM